SWLTRYLDLARLPAELTRAFSNPQDLGVRNAIALKGLLKPDDRKARALAEASRIADAREAGAPAQSILDVIKALSLAVDAPKKTGSPKKTGKAETVSTAAGKPVLRIESADRKGVRLTLLNKGGATRQDAEEAIRSLLDEHWPQ
ncbi:MAG TPA: hypothetical protein VF523_01510, partial [Burkholderiales bacterium]